MLRHAISSLDPRLKIIFALSLGILVWQAHFILLAFLLVMMASLVLWFNVGANVSRIGLAYLLFFVLFWMVIKGFLSIWQGNGIEGAVFDAALFGARLFIFVFLGLLLILSTSARQLGLGFSALFRPFLGSKTWQISLALSLMLHFLPLTLNVFEQVKRGYQSRRLDLPFLNRSVVQLQAGLRILSEKTWEQTLALAARGLDRPEEWEQRLECKFWHWAILFLFLSGVLGLNLYCNGVL